MPKANHLVQKELPKHRLAYLVYREGILAGSTIKQAIQMVCKKFNINKTTAYSWRRSFKWDDKIMENLEELDKEKMEATSKHLEELRESLVTAVTHPLQENLKSIREGKKPVKIRTVTDLEKITKLILLLNGEYTERKKVDTDGQITHDILRYEDIEEYIQSIEEIEVNEGDTEEDRTAVE